MRLFDTTIVGNGTFIVDIYFSYKGAPPKRYVYRFLHPMTTIDISPVSHTEIGVMFANLAQLSYLGGSWGHHLAGLTMVVSHRVFP